MNLSFRFGTEGESNVQVLGQDDERVLGRGWRLDPNGQRQAVLVVLPTTEHPTPSSLDRLAHEYELKDELDNAWAARPLELVREGGRTMLVLEDPGGEPLDRLLGAPMELGRFVRVAIGIAIALGKLHQRGLVHMDLKPGNILVTGADGQMRLTGFGLASRLPRQRPAPEPPETIAGTLAYMAPEQTGRMNRSIDARSDLYALGIIFYQMLTGVLPFAASDPMGWVHCHIARQPMSPAERLKGIPEPLSAIVMKLLAKTAEERYQTAAGLAHDLRRCLAAWTTQSRIEAFPLGTQDLPDRLLIPEKLYGREREIEILLAAFDHVVQGGVPELVLVSGYSGIGKSSVVHELHKVLVPSRGLFASGKFDQHKRDIPYATLAQAFQSLIRGLLAKSETELAGWRDALREALGSNGQLMVDVVPELRLIIGQQPPVPPLEPQQAHGRFQLVFRRFIGVFARSEHPLVLFLDDLQWLDAATLDLLEDLLIRSDLRHLMLIGAYRDNEVTADHPLMRKLDAIKSAGGTVAAITVARLAREHLGQLMADALRCAPERAAPLARLVHEKTGGNPFFAIQFLSSLAEEGMLTFDHDATRWCWDLNRIHAKRYSDNVVDLMVGKLTRLPAETLKALQQLACLGNITELTTLSIVFETSEEQIHVALWPAVRQELVERLTGTYRFVHDRIQEAAYSLIPEELRGEAHLRIGRLLATHIPPEKREEAIFDIVNQFNRGAALVTSRDECEQLAELNLLAGQRAKDSTAHAAALTYFTAGAALLPEDTWARRPELVFALALHRAECEFLTGALTEAEARFAELADRATSLPDLAAITRLQVELFTTLGRSDSAVEVTLDYLRRVGIAWSAHPTKEEVRQEYARMWRQLGDRPIEALLDLPRMADPAACGTMNILTAVVPAARHTDENLRPLVIGRMANLSLEHGNSDASCHAYAMLGTVLGPEFGDYKAGFRFGQLGLNLVEQRGLRRFEARVSVSFGAVINPWTRHVQTGRQWVRRAFDTANRLGDLTFAAYSRNNLITNLLAAGDPLAEVQREAEAGLDFARQARFGLVIVFITTQLQLIRTLRGLTPAFGRFDDAGFDEGRFERHLEADPGLSIAACWYWIRNLQARFFARAYASGLEAASKAQRLLWTMPAHLEWAEFHFYAALVRAALCDAARAAERSRHLEALTTHHRQLQEWTENCPENFANRAALIGAEIARLEGRELEAERLYEQAIRSARGNGFVHNEAIAYERASAFYRARGFDEFAETYLRKARACYARWGADGKVRQLDQLYPHLREDEPAPGPTRTIGAPVEHLDLATVIKVSQAISGEIVLEKLIDTVLRTAIEQAGAARGLLILARGTELRIAAEATTRGDTVVVQLCDETVTATILPESVLHYVLRTRESVILDDALAESPFAADPYIRQCKARSILCLPLLNQAKLIGMLYLENNLAPRVFVPARIAVLKLLASQAAISLENTVLYRDLAEREARIRRLVEANIIGIFIFGLDGRILEANDAFLRIVGYDREDLATGRLRWTNLTPPEWLDRDARQWVPELERTGILPPFEKEYFRKDGSRVPVLIGVALFKEGGDQGVTFVLDLTERKRGEEELRRSEAYLAEAEALSKSGSWAWNPATKAIIYWSQERYRLFGFDPEAGIPSFEALLQRIHPEDRARWLGNAERAVRIRGDSETDFRIVLPDGETKHLHGVGHPVFSETGELLEVIGAAMDVTERKRAEEVLQKAQAELAHVTRVTTMSALTSSIAHEVNQPLAAIVTNANAALRWLAHQPPNLDEARETAGRIVQDGHRAGAVIGRVRALLRKTATVKERLDLNDLIQDTVALVQGEVHRHRILLRTELSLNLPPVAGDRVQLQQVILNLVLNGLEAMKEGAERPRELLIRSRLDETGAVLVAVHDTGVGLDPQHVERVFEAFYTTKPEGMGMGLAICRSIIEAHGGQLWASANEPRGAVFQFTLSAEQDETAPGKTLRNG
ncbi:AAA family ATPase [Microvirga sp. VF16]|uniref:AAA family ATPase n=1 Tax=Microvirga sp. VF16 TaxID=2807101 RepID=UPI00193D42F5|nr:AAA family ATPase [Microvirga sp. VF16]QRM34255.1 AAA family ATPase [Microvirga sp. VF16]